MTAVDHAELKRLEDELVQMLAPDQGESAHPAFGHAVCIQNAHAALLSEIEGLKAERAKGLEDDTVQPIERAIKALKRDIAAIQDAKRRGGSGASLTDCINRLPEIVRWLESGLFDVETAFEHYEDAADLRTQAPDSWRPIDDDAKDGRPILAGSVHHDSREVVCWQDGLESGSLEAIESGQPEQGWVNDGPIKDRFYANPNYFTHWQPIALRPQTAESGK